MSSEEHATIVVGGPWAAAASLSMRFSPDRAMLRHFAGIGRTRTRPAR